jgi:hypothetical protein
VHCGQIFSAGKTRFSSSNTIFAHILALAWDGIISVALYINSPEFLRKYSSEIYELHNKIELRQGCRLDMSLYVENRTREERMLYPINLLR